MTYFVNLCQQFTVNNFCHCAAKVDEIASVVMGPETRAALNDGWNSLKNGFLNIATYLSIVGEQPQAESK